MRNTLLAILFTTGLMACGSGASDATHTTGNPDQGNQPTGYVPYQPAQPGQPYQPVHPGQPPHHYQGAVGSFDGNYSGIVTVSRPNQRPSQENFQISVQQNQAGINLRTSMVEGCQIMNEPVAIRGNRIFDEAKQIGEIDQNGFYYRDQSATTVQFDREQNGMMHVRIELKDQRGTLLVEGELRCN